MTDIEDKTTRRLVFLVDPHDVTDEQIYGMLMGGDEDRIEAEEPVDRPVGSAPRGGPVILLGVAGLDQERKP